MRSALIDAAELLIREGGYPSVTARNLADKINLKRQIVHYYFHSMDDLFIAVIRRGADKARPRLEAALDSAEPRSAGSNREKRSSSRSKESASSSTAP